MPAFQASFEVEKLMWEICEAEQLLLSVMAMSPSKKVVDH